MRRPPAPDLELRSADRAFGLRLTGLQLAQLRTRCSRSWPHETGGILVGRYTPALDLAIVTRLPPASRDSRSARARFVRGERGLAKMLARLWGHPPAHRTYYLGEWHYHPNHPPAPSQEDGARMRGIAAARCYHCPEALLLLVGGSAVTGWALAAQVHLASGQRVPLLPPGGPGG
jgi:integrative and conjugative element protein (TIGR02256 family)